MKILLVTMALLVSHVTFAADSSDKGEVSLDHGTQFRIISALLSSKVAEDTYFGEASVAEIMSRDVSTMLTSEVSLRDGKGEKTEIRLTCIKLKKAATSISCKLLSYSEYTDSEGTYESAMWIQGDVYIPALSTKVNISNVSTGAAG